ncbi:MAG: hypothetical protein WD898_00335 [Candidatus Paceibacterota bacterium]
MTFSGNPFMHLLASSVVMIFLLALFWAAVRWEGRSGKDPFARGWDRFLVSQVAIGVLMVVDFFWIGLSCLGVYSLYRFIL